MWWVTAVVIVMSQPLPRAQWFPATSLEGRGIQLDLGLMPINFLVPWRPESPGSSQVGRALRGNSDDRIPQDSAMGPHLTGKQSFLAQNW